MVQHQEQDSQVEVQRRELLILSWERLQMTVIEEVKFEVEGNQVLIQIQMLLTQILMKQTLLSSLTSLS